MNEAIFSIINFDTLLHLGQVFATDYYGDDDSGPMFWLLGPISAVAFYSWKYLKYRNTDKRHAFEYKTSSEIGQILANDQKIGEVKGVRNSDIEGQNSGQPLMRLGQGSTFIESWRK